MKAGLALAAHDTVIRRIVLATAFSAAAEGIFLGALPLAVAARGGGPLEVGLAAAALTIWYAASVPLGAAVDRLGVGRSLRILAPLRIPALLIIAAGETMAGHDGLALIFVGALIYGLFSTLTDTATSALPALIISQDHYDEVFPVLSAVGQGLSLIAGPSVGALLLVTSHWLPFAVSGAALAGAYAATTPFFVDQRTQRSDPDSEVPGWLGRTLAGLRHIFSDTFLRAIALTLIGIAISEELIQVTIAPYVRAGSGTGEWPQLLGYARSAAGLTSILAALLAGNLARRFTRTKVLAAAATAGALSPAVLAIAPRWALVLLALIISAVAEAIWVPLMQTEMARRTPGHLMARTRSALMFLAWGALPVASIAGGTLAQVIGIRPILLAASLAALTSCAFGIWRLYGKPEEPAPTPPDQAETPAAPAH
jgi:MFS family permease